MRASARYIVLVQFALAILAAITIDDLLAIADGAAGELRRFAALLWIPAALGIVTTLAAEYRHPALWPAYLRRCGRRVSWRRDRRRRDAPDVPCGPPAAWAIPALVVVTAAGSRAWGIRFVYLGARANDRGAHQQVPAGAARHRPTPTRSRHGTGPYSSDLLVLRGYRLTSGYVGLFPRRPASPRKRGRDPAVRHAMDLHARRRPAAVRRRGCTSSPARRAGRRCGWKRAALRRPAGPARGRRRCAGTTHPGVHGAISTTAGRRRPTARPSQPSAWTTIFSAASWPMALMK